MALERMYVPLVAFALSMCLRSNVAWPLTDDSPEASTTFLDSSVVTSISMVARGKDLDGENVNPTKGRIVQSSSSLGANSYRLPPSPANLLKPDGFQFYTYNERGDMITKQMTMQEIQALIAGGGPDHSNVEVQEPQKADDILTGGKKVMDVVEKVQSVLKSAMDKPSTLSGSIPSIPEQANAEWSNILPAILAGEKVDEIAPHLETVAEVAGTTTKPAIANTLNDALQTDTMQSIPLKSPESMVLETNSSAAAIAIESPQSPEQKEDRIASSPVFEVYSEKTMIPVPVITTEQKQQTLQTTTQSAVFHKLTDISHLPKTETETETTMIQFITDDRKRPVIEITSEVPASTFSAVTSVYASLTTPLESWTMENNSVTKASDLESGQSMQPLSTELANSLSSVINQVSEAVSSVLPVSSELESVESSKQPIEIIQHSANVQKEEEDREDKDSTETPTSKTPTSHPWKASERENGTTVLENTTADISWPASTDATQREETTEGFSSSKAELDGTHGQPSLQTIETTETDAVPMTSAATLQRDTPISSSFITSSPSIDETRFPTDVSTDVGLQLNSNPIATIESILKTVSTEANTPVTQTLVLPDVSDLSGNLPIKTLASGLVAGFGPLVTQHLLENTSSKLPSLENTTPSTKSTNDHQRTEEIAEKDGTFKRKENATDIEEGDSTNEHESTTPQTTAKFTIVPTSSLAITDTASTLNGITTERNVLPLNPTTPRYEESTNAVTEIPALEIISNLDRVPEQTSSTGQQQVETSLSSSSSSSSSPSSTEEIEKPSLSTTMTSYDLVAVGQPSMNTNTINGYPSTSTEAQPYLVQQETEKQHVSTRFEQSDSTTKDSIDQRVEGKQNRTDAHDSNGFVAVQSVLQDRLSMQTTLIPNINPVTAILLQESTNDGWNATSSLSTTTNDISVEPTKTTTKVPLNGIDETNKLTVVAANVSDSKDEFIRIANETQLEEKREDFSTTISSTTELPVIEPSSTMKTSDSEDPDIASEDKWQLISLHQTAPSWSTKLVAANKQPEEDTKSSSSTVEPFQVDLDSSSTESSAALSLDASKSVGGLDTSTKNTSTDIVNFSRLCNELAFKFWISANKGLSTARSLALSPFGIVSLLAMIFLGARGPTSDQMNEVLGLDNVATFNPHLIFQNVTDAVSLARQQGIANAAFVRELFADKAKVRKLMPFYKEQAQQFYEGLVAEVNFATISDLVRRRTNLLVRKQTGGRIKDFVKSNAVPLRSPLAAISANVFQTDCNSSMASGTGRDGELYFAVSPALRLRKLIPVPATVWRSSVLAGYEPGLDATAVALGGIGKLVSTIFLLPGQQGHAAPGDTLDRLEQRLLKGPFRDGAWDKLLKVLIPRTGLELQVPKFSHRSVVNATAALKRMGLDQLFSGHADFKGINGIGNRLFLSDVLQMNLFSTCGDENIANGRHHVETYPASPSLRNSQRHFGGHEDAEQNVEGQLRDQIFTDYRSALASGMTKASGRSAERPRLKLDQPFLYFVRHNPTGLILHMGRFNPRLLS